MVLGTLRLKTIELEGEISYLTKASVPIGFTYIQFPGKPEPSVLYYGVWANVSDEYPGDFFRVEGGRAASFGSGQQNHQFETHAHYHRHYFRYGQDGSYGPAADSNSSIGYGYTSYSGVNPTSGAHGAETRPVNRTIRIWKRIS